MQANLSSADAPATHRLWQPDAAANWSLLFTPLFGAYLHMRNWEALGQPKKALRARCWVWASFVMLVLNAWADAIEARLNVEPALVRWSTVVYLLAWYFGEARSQIRTVRSHYGSAYEREPWDGVVVTGVALGVVYLIGKALLTMLLTATT